MIEIRGLSKSYRSAAGEQRVLDAVDLAVADGEFVSIMGPSGAGKTSLLSVLGLLDNDWQGAYVLAGHPLQALKEAERKTLARERIAFVFQHYHLLDDLNVAENIALPLDYRGMPRSERKLRTDEVLEQFGIADKRALFPRQLSGGQQQLVAVARAIAGRPQVLLADEPTGALHSSQGEMIMDVLQSLNRSGTTIVQVTHQPDFAARAHRVLQMRDGRLSGGR